jgi:hypothetical protein
MSPPHWWFRVRPVRPRWLAVLLIVVGVLLGVAIAGIPSRGNDMPIKVVTPTSRTVPTTTMASTTTTVPPPTTLANTTTTSALSRRR